ncbi:MAG: putative tryptophanase leader peptide [SAR86 cluster bacterium SAR86B]|uniref:Putative tryptophanase leader peptide n=1 Tax=SAR86 cluster bacterium SAR86B TaxID=1123867 RepID=J4WW51_9GAMM|nr:MAG: putative tryptophanase leader peptide [SAR86 cluster bacterium SAR86B]
MYLPHGVRVLGIVFFGIRVFPALLAAELIGPYFIEPEHYFDEWFIGGAISILCVIASVRLLEWVNVDNKTSFFRPLNFTNYRFLFLAVILSALFNAIASNIVVQFFVPEIDVAPIHIFRFFIGDTLGAVVFFLFLTLLFTTLADLKLVERYKKASKKVNIDK